MKFKPLYAYLSLIIILVVLLVVFTQKNNEELPQDVANKEIPNDDIHNGLKNGDTPNKSNVSADIMHKMEELKKGTEENPDDTLKLKEYADFLTEMNRKAYHFYRLLLHFRKLF